MAKLVEIAGYTPGREIPVGEALVLGREPGAGGLVISNREASRRHARISRDATGYHIEDLNSANGTYVDGVRRQDSSLVDGTLLTIGRTTFRFNLDSQTSLDSGANIPRVHQSLPAPLGMGPRPPVPPEGTTIPQSSHLAHSPLATAAHNGPQLAAHGAPHLPAQSLAAGPAVANRRSPVWNLTLDARTMMGMAPSGQDSENLRRERDILNHLFEISRTLGTILHLPALAQEILSKLFELFPVAENVSIHLLEKDALLPLAARSRSGGATAAPHISQTIASMALSDRQSILSTDAAEDARFLNKESIILQKVRSFMCSPLLFRDEALGILYVDTTDARPRFFPDDLHLLTAVCAQMAVAVKNSQLLSDNLREAEVRSHLSRYLPPDLVDQVIHHQIDITPGGSLAQGTVLFSDVIGFTPMAERMGPEPLVQTLNNYFEHMVELIFQHGGSVNRFGGDSIMALWGVPVQRENDALRAVRSAVEMQAAIFGFNLTWAEGLTHPIRVGIGLNTGRFVVGNIGSERHMEYTVLGNDVNMAQRVESQAAAWQVFISENTYQQVREHVSVFVLPPTSLKGLRTPMPIYSVRAVADQEAILCAIPARIGLPDRTSAAAMVVRLSTDSLLDVWLGRQPEPGSRVAIRLDPPESPALEVLSGVVTQVEPLEEFSTENGREAWKTRIKLEGEIPPILRPTTQLFPAPDRGYLVRE